MKLSVVLFYLFFSASLIVLAESFIAINIDPEDLDRVSEFFHSIILSEPAQTIVQRERHIFRAMVKKTIFGVIQLTGVMMSLVGASVISSSFVHEAPAIQPQQPQQASQQPPHQPPQQPQEAQYPEQLENIVLKCTNLDFGCSVNYCWKTCFEKASNGKNLWCHTSPKSNALHHCKSSDECSICWDCVEKCHE